MHMMPRMHGRVPVRAESVVCVLSQLLLSFYPRLPKRCMPFAFLGMTDCDFGAVLHSFRKHFSVLMTSIADTLLLYLDLSCLVEPASLRSPPWLCKHDHLPP